MGSAECTGTLRKSMRAVMLTSKSKTYNTTNLQLHGVHSCLLRGRNPISQRYTSTYSRFQVEINLKSVKSWKVPEVRNFQLSRVNSEFMQLKLKSSRCFELTKSCVAFIGTRLHNATWTWWARTYKIQNRFLLVLWCSRVNINITFSFFFLSTQAEQRQIFEIRAENFRSEDKHKKYNSKRGSHIRPSWVFMLFRYPPRIGSWRGWCFTWEENRNTQRKPLKERWERTTNSTQ